MQEQVTPQAAALTILGAVVGAGFASGQEIYYFFVRFGDAASLGLAASAVGFWFLMWLFTRISLKQQINDYPSLLVVLGGARAAAFFRHVFAVFLFCGLLVMLAGSASLLGDLFGISRLTIGLLTALLVYFVVSQRTSGVAKANGWLMPCLLFLYLFYLLRSLPFGPLPGPAVIPQRLGAATWSGLLYVALNSSMLLVLAPPLAAQAKSTKAAYRGVLLATLLLEALFLLVIYLLTKFGQLAQSQELPLLAVARHLLPQLPWLYAVPLWIALATTAFADAIGLKVYLEQCWLRLAKPLFVALLLAAAVLSQLPFSMFIQFVYPFMGYACLAFYAFCCGRWLLRSLTA